MRAGEIHEFVPDRIATRPALPPRQAIAQLLDVRGDVAGSRGAGAGTGAVLEERSGLGAGCEQERGREDEQRGKSAGHGGEVGNGTGRVRALL